MKGMLKFFKLDIRKSVVAWMVLLLVEAMILLALKYNQPVLLAYYFNFMGIYLVAIIVCLIDECNEVGFVDLLPGTQKQKIVARFLYGVAMALSGNVILAILILATHIPTQLKGYLGFSMFFCMGIQLVILAIQYILFYKTARKKSKMVSALATFLPGCLTMYVNAAAVIVSLRYSNAKLLEIFHKVVVFGPLVCVAAILFYIFATQRTIHFMKKEDLL